MDSFCIFIKPQLQSKLFRQKWINHEVDWSNIKMIDKNVDGAIYLTKSIHHQYLQNKKRHLCAKNVVWGSKIWSILKLVLVAANPYTQGDIYYSKSIYSTTEIEF